MITSGWSGSSASASGSARTSPAGRIQFVAAERVARLVDALVGAEARVILERRRRSRVSSCSRTEAGGRRPARQVRRCRRARASSGGRAPRRRRAARARRRSARRSSPAPVAPSGADEAAPPAGDLLKARPCRSAPSPRAAADWRARSGTPSCRRHAAPPWLLSTVTRLTATAWQIRYGSSVRGIDRDRNDGRRHRHGRQGLHHRLDDRGRLDGQRRHRERGNDLRQSGRRDGESGDGLVDRRLDGRLDVVLRCGSGLGGGRRRARGRSRSRRRSWPGVAGTEGRAGASGRGGAAARTTAGGVEGTEAREQSRQRQTEAGLEAGTTACRLRPRAPRRASAGRRRSSRGRRFLRRCRLPRPPRR